MCFDFLSRSNRYLLCFCEFKNTHTHFPSCMHFAQTLSLVLYSPPLEQLLEES